METKRVALATMSALTVVGVWSPFGVAARTPADGHRGVIGRRMDQHRERLGSRDGLGAVSGPDLATR
jgi:hypothetical protein